jgi:hypothetical protein
MIYQIADLRIELKNRFPYTEQFCAEYLDDDQRAVADISVEVTKEEFKREKRSSPEYSDGYLENILFNEKNGMK